MPELPEVESLAAGLRERAAGLVIDRADPAEFSVLKTYDPEGKFGTEIVRRMIFGDTLVIRPTQELARDMLSVGLLGYTYVFAYVPKSVRSLTPGAWHGAEFNYFFGTLATRSAAQRAATAEDDSMSAKFRAYWVNFARTGRPDAAGGPEWGSARAGTMVFANDGPHFSREYLKTRLDVLGNAF